jgi:hypothetical protein
LLRKKLAVEARAHVADDVDDAMPASGHTGGHARATPEEEAAPASRPSGGARQGGAARREAHLWHLCDSTLTRDRLNVRALQPDGAYQADMKAFWGNLGKSWYQADMELIW